ncbi:putative CAS1 domain-containing protein 1 [Hypsibius exemplaris]|uniref:CAS1 domain-containing protein 1 n=1 Tax=Hypsibius exemplaris TaxID=2072580 RepID=A0A1W0W8N7_HYPEX|nr:putative CAS1 domain-containing protein 1 [Hypsibius exemplaris]
MNSTGNTCAKLFQTGSLKWNLKDATAIWEPNGCSLQYRSINEAKQCMNDLTDKTSKVPFLLFVGDSRIQQLRDGLILTLTGHDYDVRAGRQSVLNSTSYSQLGADENIYKSSGIQIKFEWQPYLDNGFGPMSSFLKNVSKLQFRPNMLVIGAGVWSIKDCQVNNKNQDACVQNYKEQFKAIHPLLEEMATTTDVIWTPQCAISEKVLSYNNKDLGFTNRNMHLYNDVVRQVLMDAKRSGESKVIFWESAWEANYLSGQWTPNWYGYSERWTAYQDGERSCRTVDSFSGQ